jgi:hypothetical protein
LIVSEAVFELAKAAPEEAMPEIPTLYGVGAVSWIEAGIVKVTRSVVPATVATAVAVVLTAVPPAAGVRSR